MLREGNCYKFQHKTEDYELNKHDHQIKNAQFDFLSSFTRKVAKMIAVL